MVREKAGEPFPSEVRREAARTTIGVLGNYKNEKNVQ